MGTLKKSRQNGLLPTLESKNQMGYQVSKGKKYQGLEQVLTSLPAGSPASPSVPPENSEARKMTAGSGQRCLGLFAKSDPVGLLAKTLLESLRWRSTRCLLTWKVKATPAKRLLYQLAVSTPRTKETGCGLLPTARAGDRTAKGNPKSRLETEIAMLPTPTGTDYKSRGPNSKQVGIDNFLKLLPTLATSRGGQNRKSSLAGKHGLRLESIGIVAQECGKGAGLKLQPNFVEWMQGYPQNWTDLNCRNQDIGYKD